MLVQYGLLPPPLPPGVSPLSAIVSAMMMMLPGVDDLNLVYVERAKGLGNAALVRRPRPRGPRPPGAAGRAEGRRRRPGRSVQCIDSNIVYNRKHLFANVSSIPAPVCDAVRRECRVSDDPRGRVPLRGCPAAWPSPGAGCGGGGGWRPWPWRRRGGTVVAAAGGEGGVGDHPGGAM